MVWCGIVWYRMVYGRCGIVWHGTVCFGVCDWIGLDSMIGWCDCMVWWCGVLYCIVLYGIVVWCMILYSIVWYGSVIVRYGMMVGCVVLYCMVSYGMVVCCVMYCIVLYGIIWCIPGWCNWCQVLADCLDHPASPHPQANRNAHTAEHQDPDRNINLLLDLSSPENNPQRDQRPNGIAADRN